MGVRDLWVVNAMCMGEKKSKRLTTKSQKDKKRKQNRNEMKKKKEYNFPFAHPLLEANVMNGDIFPQKLSCIISQWKTTMSQTNTHKHPLPYVHNSTKLSKSNNTNNDISSLVDIPAAMKATSLHLYNENEHSLYQLQQQQQLEPTMSSAKHSVWGF